MSNFAYMSGTGNDFIVGKYEGEVSEIQIIALVSDSEYEVDGVIFVEPLDNNSVKMHYYNNDGSDAELCVNGVRCAAQKDKELVRERAPWVDVVIGTHNLTNIINLLNQSEDWGPITEIIDEIEYLPTDAPSIRESEHSAWLTIQIGCNNSCTFCIVPSVRGPEISRRPSDIINEAQELVESGIKEITLLGQNVNAWSSKGLDNQNWGLGRLIDELAKINELKFIRYTTSHPLDMDIELIKCHRDNKKLMPYLHLPIQSGSDKVLKMMNRKHTAKEYLKIIEKIRQYNPEIAISGDFIVGFPGEKKEHFEHLLDFLNRHKFDHVGVFIFSSEEGTAAFHLPNKVSPEVAEARKDNVISVQQNISKDKNQAYVGSKMKVLVEKISDNNELIGRSYNFSPEIDGNVILSINTKNDFKNYIGKFVEANISFADEYDLYGEIIKIF